MSISDLTSNEEKLSRVGKKWLQEEDVILVREINDKKTFEEISLEHKRTILGIKSRVISQILYPKYKNDNISLDELSTEYDIEKELVEKYINKLEGDSKEESSETKPKTNRKLSFENITSLETKMFTIEKKLDFIISIISK